MTETKKDAKNEVKYNETEDNSQRTWAEKNVATIHGIGMLAALVIFGIVHTLLTS